MSANVLSRNDNYDFVKYTKDYKTLDKVVLLESNHAWVHNVDYLKRDFKYHSLHPRHDNFGISFFSKEPYQGGVEVFKTTGALKYEFPYVWAEFLNETPFVFIAIHPPPPVGKVVAAARDEFMVFLANKVQQYPNKKFVIMGDFNDSLWSYNFRAFLKGSGLKNTAVGLYDTWPTGIAGTGVLGIHIDHALVKGMKVQSFKIGENMGSDHLPIILEVIK